MNCDYKKTTILVTLLYLCAITIFAYALFDYHQRIGFFSEQSNGFPEALTAVIIALVGWQISIAIKVIELRKYGRG